MIDYKTDQVEASECEAHAPEHHSGQASVYARGLSSVTRSPVREVVFVYCRPGDEVALTP